MDMGSSEQCFEILSIHSYSSLQTQNAANDDRMEEKGYKICQEWDKKDIWLSYGLSVEMWVTAWLNNCDLVRARFEESVFQI